MKALFQQTLLCYFRQNGRSAIPAFGLEVYTMRCLLLPAIVAFLVWGRGVGPHQDRTAMICPQEEGAVELGALWRGAKPRQQRTTRCPQEVAQVEMMRVD